MRASVLISPSPLMALREKGIKGVRVPRWGGAVPYTPASPDPTYLNHLTFRKRKRADAPRAPAPKRPYVKPEAYTPFFPLIPFNTAPGDIGSSRNLTPVAL